MKGASKMKTRKNAETIAVVRERERERAVFRWNRA